MKERWRKVPGYPRYLVSDRGRVQSPQKMLSVRGTGPGGRPRVVLSRSCEKRKWFLVYRLVLLAFVGPCPRGMEARHYPDRTVTNCRLNNLVWGTHEQNSQDMVKHGRVNQNRRSDGRFQGYAS